MQALDNKKITVMIVDDHPLVADSLASYLNSLTEVDKTLVFNNTNEVVAACDDFKPDVIFLDIVIPGICSFQIARDIISKDKNIKIIFLTGAITDYNIESALDAGAMGILSKGTESDQIKIALNSVVENKKYFSEEVVKRFEHLGDNLKTLGSKLTNREREICKYIASGVRVELIAKNLKISKNTVCRHRENILRKLSLSGQVELTIYAHKEGIV